MKNLLALAAVSVMLSSASAFASCPCNLERAYYPGESAPKVCITQPIVTPCPCQPVVAPCNKCNTCGEKTSFFGNIANGTKSIYNATFGNLFSMFGI